MKTFILTLDGYGDSTITGETASKAKYEKWLRVEDALGMSFGEFCKRSKIRTLPDVRETTE